MAIRLEFKQVDKIEVTKYPEDVEIKWDGYNILFPKQFRDEEIYYKYREPRELLKLDNVERVLNALGFDVYRTVEGIGYLSFEYDKRQPKIFAWYCDPYCVVSYLLGKRYEVCTVDMDKVRFLWSKFMTWLVFNLYLNNWIMLMKNLVLNSNLGSEKGEPPLLLLPMKLNDIDEKLLLCVLDPYDKYEYVATRIAFSLSSSQI